ncbi:MAG TPA: SIS domain-containing protein [Methylomirabilota bacterium]|jgi:D-sedoheptulose 7-phosphate isomerase|nr:SIS domain-containing protein [Methylomirabilota bacterium]
MHGEFSEQVRHITQNYLRAFTLLLQRVDLDAVTRVVERLRRVRDEGATVYVAGNGGSAATASHWVNDLGKTTKRSGRAPLRVVGLSDNLPWLTALANDEGYERVFAGQLENFARPGDVLVVISASGNSLNLVRAVELARNRGLFTIGLLGFDGGVLRTMVNDYLWLPTEHGAYELVEDGHMLLCHVLTTCLVRDHAVTTPAS